MRYQLRHSPVLFSNGLQVTAQNWLPTNPLAVAIFYLIWLGHVVFSLIDFHPLGLGGLGPVGDVPIGAHEQVTGVVGVEVHDDVAGLLRDRKSVV